MNYSFKVSNVIVPGNLSGSTEGVSWDVVPGASKYIVEYSQDNFENVFSLETVSNKVDFFDLPAGVWQWRVKALGGAASDSEQIITSGKIDVQQLVSEANGNTDMFFANANGKWACGYAAQHAGILNGWNGTGEQVSLTGKNKLSDIFEGSADANVLVMTDDANGDALFVDDIYSALPGTVAEQQARIAQINEIRAGVGDDIVDMTSPRFAYIGDGIKIYGGLGNDTIWANNGSNTLFGDAGNDRIVGGADNDVIIGGIGNDSMHGGGGDDIFCFGVNWGTDTIAQLEGGTVTLWFENGSESNWDAATLTYTDGENSVKVTGIANVTLKFGTDAELPVGAFADAASEKIFENKNRGLLA
jgi:Ca2+-binding RTX toxin-like protein